MFLHQGLGGNLCSWHFIPDQPHEHPPDERFEKFFAFLQAILNLRIDRDAEHFTVEIRHQNIKI